MSLTTSQPEEFARALSSRLNISKVADLFEIARQFRLKICEVDSVSFEGALIRATNKPGGVIAVKDDIRESGRKRFTIAHELGHYILPGHGLADTPCKSEHIESWGKEIPDQEIAANRFASELLLPTALVRLVVQQRRASLKTAKTLRADFQTSLTAAALKCVEVTDEQCAFINSINGVVKWYNPSSRFQYYIRAGEEVSADSLASQLSKEAEQREKSGSVLAEAWISNYRLLQNAKVWEDSILLPYYNSVLTIITITEPLEKDTHTYEEDALLEELDPDEFTISRRKWPGRR